MGNKKYRGGGAVDAVDHVYGHLPRFDEIFDEETFYIFAVGIVIMSIVVAFVLSRFITLKDHDD